MWKKKIAEIREGSKKSRTEFGLLLDIRDTLFLISEQLKNIEGKLNG